jgi:hypothetical protein
LNLVPRTLQRPHIFFGWWIVSLAGFLHSINSSAYNKGFVVFLLPVSEGLGVSRAAISLIFSFLIRSTPESVGMLPDGGPPVNSSRGQYPGIQRNVSAREVRPSDFEMREALHTLSYWLLLTGSILRLTAKAGVILHIIPIMVWKDIDAPTGAFIFGFLLFLGVPLSMFFGWLADTLPKNLVLFISAISGTIAFFLLATPLSSIWIIYLFVFLFAIAETSGSNNWATFGDYFGRKAYGRLRGITQLASSPGVFLAPVFAGWWYDRVEIYTLPLWVFTIFFALGALTFAFMCKPNVVHRAEGLGFCLLREITSPTLVFGKETRLGKAGRWTIFFVPTFTAFELLGKEPPPGRGGTIHRHIQH